jgi:hypothetical protein
MLVDGKAINRAANSVLRVQYAEFTKAFLTLEMSYGFTVHA